MNNHLDKLREQSANPKVRLLFDATILREGVRRGFGRSGIFNVAREILKRISANPKFSVMVISDLADEVDVRSFLATEEGLSAITVFSPADSLSSIARIVLMVRTFLDRHPAQSKKRSFCYGLLVTAYSCVRMVVLRIMCLLDRFEQRRRKSPAKIIKENFDAYFTPAFAPPSYVRQSGIRVYIILYDLIPILFPDLFPNRGGGWITQLIDDLRPTDFGFAISQATRADFVKHIANVSESRIDVIPLGAAERFSACTDINRIKTIRKKYGIPDNCRYFMGLSSIAPHKNIPFMLRAFAKVAATNPDVYFVLAGARFDFYSKDFDDTLSSLGECRDRVLQVGYVDDNDVAALYSGAIAFVYISLYEGFGLPPLEAMQCGCPVLTSNTSSLPEVVGDAGLMVSPSDLESAIDAMMRLATDSNLRSQLRVKGLERAKLFSWDKAADIIANKMLEDMRS